MPLVSMNQTEPVSMENDIGTPISASATIIMIIIKSSFFLLTPSQSYPAQTGGYS